MSSSANNSSSAVVVGSATDVLANRRLPPTASGNKPAGDNPSGATANGSNGHARTGSGVDVAGIARLLQGVVLDKDDAVAALNKLLQRSLRAVPYVKLQHVREVLEKLEACVYTLESHCSDADIEARLTPGSRVSRLKFDTLKNMAMRDDGSSSTHRVSIPDNRLNSIPGASPDHNGDAALRNTPNSQQRAAAIASASLSSLQMAAMIGTKSGSALSSSSSSATNGNGNSSGNSSSNSSVNGDSTNSSNNGSGNNSANNRRSPTEEPVVYVPMPTKIVPVKDFTKDFDSPSMVRRTLGGGKRHASARRAAAADSDSDDEETKKDAPPQLGLGLRGSGVMASSGAPSAGAGGEGAMKPRNKLLDKVAGGHVRSSSRAANPPTMGASSQQSTVQPPSSTSVSSSTSNTTSMDSPNLGGRRLGGGGGAGKGAASRAQSSLVAAAISNRASKSATMSSEALPEPADEQKDLPTPPPMTTDVSPTSSGFIAPPPSVSNTPAHTPSLSAGELVMPLPSTEQHRTQLQQLLQRALRLVPAFQYTPSAFRQLHTQLETAVAFMEERCSAVPVNASNGK